MSSRLRAATAVVAAFLTVSTALTSPAWADNKMGYQLLSSEEAAGLPHNRGSLGLDIERAQQITDGGMTFDILGVKQVRRGSAGEKAGFAHGDEIIAVDGRVFANLQAFAAYVGSVRPGTPISVDYIPAGGGPAQAQRVAVVVGAAGAQGAAPPQAGMSTGTKVAIGVGAAALLGCYEMGCFHRNATPQAATRPQPNGYPQQGQFQQPNAYQRAQ